MEYIKAFLIGGLICAIVQIFMDKTKLMPGRIMVILVCLGALLGAIGLYQPFIDFAGAGASVPLLGFGNTLWKGVKEAVDKAFEAYQNEYKTALYAIGSVVGPHPFPSIVEYFQSVIGKESREQFINMTGGLPDCVIACVGGGSNAIGMFDGFIDDKEVELYGIEPLGKGEKIGENAASLTYGREGIIHGFKCLLLQNEDNTVADAYSVASGLDYPGVGPKHCYLKDIGRVKYRTINDDEAINAFYELSRTEGIIPALESSHAVAYGLKIAKDYQGKKILINLSGRGDKDIDFVLENYPRKF